MRDPTGEEQQHRGGLHIGGRWPGMQKIARMVKRHDDHDQPSDDIYRIDSGFHHRCLFIQDNAALTNSSF